MKIKLFNQFVKHSRFMLLLMALVLLTTNNLFAQESKNNDGKLKGIYQTVEASYVVGAQIFNDNFIYTPGYTFSLSYGKMLNNSVSVGLGTALKTLEDESFLPIYGEIIGYKKNKSNTPFIRMQLGYSLGWDNRTTKAEGYEYSGGVFIGASSGRKIKVNNNFSVLLSWAYQHQFAKMEYEIFNSAAYKETLNYDMITISIGLIREM